MSINSEFLTTAPAMLGALASIVRFVIDAWLQRQRQRALQADKLESILKSPELAVLGSYLDKDLGDIDVGRYATDTEARRKVDLVLGRLNEFLGPLDDSTDSTPTPTPITTPIPAPGPVQSQAVRENESAESTTSTVTAPDTQIWQKLPQDVRQRLDAGDEWAALVRLRSALEHRVGSYLREDGVDVPEHATLGRMVASLRNLRVVEPDVIHALDLAISTMNRAAHGEDIGPDDVLRTLRAVANVMSTLDKPISGDQKKTLAEAYGINIHNLKPPGTI